MSTVRPHAPRGACRPVHQSGAATLVVVMILFFLMLLVSAYASRTLIFEQRTSANQYRSTQAFEAAQGGLEWALSMLNSERRIDTSCNPTTDPSATTFRARYLATDVVTERVTPVPASGTAFAACMRNDAGWQCQCPLTGAPALVAEANTRSAFVLRLVPPPAGAPGVMKVQVSSCSSTNDMRCFSTESVTGSEDASSLQQMQVALVRVLRAPPAAALTVVGDAAFPSGSLVQLVNIAPGGNALAIHASGSASGYQARLVLPGGTPPEAAVLDGDAALGSIPFPSRFANFSGIKQTTFRNLPGVVSLACPGGDCAAQITEAAAKGKKLFYRSGDLMLPTGTSLGTPDDPVMVVVDGRLRLEGTVQIVGLVYSTGIEWQSGTANALIRGATVVDGDCCTQVTGSPSLVYDKEVLTRLQVGAGAYARVPGSWTDRHE
ncbi:pilus assembly PilX N-terminal domain-containing protein [Aquincola sp. MAHUQ-54]|uniref:Pilus assembly PilX N-terminal domain-containing protein n=1 Tax=Aquincola agrisoli TaxID=3119538 RepID=A0AAW9QCH4_9BURK